MKKTLGIIGLILFTLIIYSCAEEQPIQNEIIKYYSDKLHDPSSLEIVNIKSITEIHTMDLLNGDLKTYQEILQDYENSLLNRPNDEFNIKQVKYYISEVDSIKNKIQELKIDSINNKIEHIEIQFSYRAKNKLGALILSDALAKMIYSDYSGDKNKYGPIYSIEDLD